jgi:hypothetical protein
VVVGTAFVIVVGTAWIAFSGHPHLTVALIVAIGILALGFAIFRGDRPRCPDWYALGAGFVVFAVYAAPVVLSGTATWAGWVKLDDGGSFLAFIDAAFSSGLVPPSHPTTSYEVLISLKFPGYSIGSFVPLGVVQHLVQIDGAWLIQPYMATLAGLLAAELCGVIRSAGGGKRASAAAAVVASCSALLYGYALWGGVKEMVLPVLLVLLATAIGHLAKPQGDVPAAGFSSLLAVLALIAMGGTRTGGYLMIAVAFGAILIAYGRSWISRRRAFGAAFGLAGVVVLGSSVARGLLERLSPPMTDSASLLRPLLPEQVAGIWIGGDFRHDPAFPLWNAVGITLVVCMAALGVAVAVRARGWALLVFAAASLGVALVTQQYAGSWLAGKALAVAGPALLACAAIGILALWNNVGPAFPPVLTRGLGVVVAFVVGVSVVASDALQFHEAWIAPRAPMRELEVIGDQFAGRGPMLMVEYSVYGARHFLRRSRAESVSDLRYHIIRLKNGDQALKGASVDVGEISLRALMRYPLIVTRAGPASSRPPANYIRVWSGRFYEVWERQNRMGRVVGEIAIGSGFQPTDFVACSAIRRIASRARPGSVIVGARRRPVLVVPLGSTSYPPRWVQSAPSGSLTPVGNGIATSSFSITTAGTYGLWLAGSFPGDLTLQLDGKKVFSGHSMVNNSPSLTYPVGRAALVRGRHVLALVYEKPWALPGSGAGPLPLGPLVLSRETGADASLKSVTVDRASALCGGQYDWVQVVVPPER